MMTLDTAIALAHASGLGEESESLVPPRNGGGYQAGLKGQKVQVPGFEPGPLAFVPLQF